MVIEFEYTTAQGPYKDSITLPDDHEFTSEQIEQMKVQRVDRWLAFLEEVRIQGEQAPIVVDAPGDLNG